MNIAQNLGLNDEIFCRMTLTTKMFLSNVLGHVAELHYENYLDAHNISFKKAPTDKHYDYVVNFERHQVKRFEVESTNNNFIGVNLTITHGNRMGEGKYYRRDAFDKLILHDVNFKRFKTIPTSVIPLNSKYNGCLPGRFKLRRSESDKLETINLEILIALKQRNKLFVVAIEELRKKLDLTYAKMLEIICSLSLDEIDKIFTEDNFRLITGAKGFVAEEHFNQFLEQHNISYRQHKSIYSKVDHWVKDKIRVQVKIPNLRSTTNDYWGIKTHKSHGHGLGELLRSDDFDILALFTGFEMIPSKSKYLPQNVTSSFLFIPNVDLERYPGHPEYLKRINRIRKDKYNVNDISIFL